MRTIKKSISIVAILLGWAMVQGQVNPTSTENYIHSTTYKKAYQESQLDGVPTNDKIETVSYYDGLGRPVQTIGVRQGGKNSGGNDTDLITPYVYDAFGRQVIEYLPLPIGTNNGKLVPTATADVQSFYHGAYADDFPTLGVSSSNPYSRRSLEASPLGRVLKQAAPGEDWILGSGHEISFDYQVNGAGEVRRYHAITPLENGTYVPSLSLDGDYGVRELYKTVTMDENHSSGTDHSTEEFTDKQGRVVLKRTYDGTAHDTYYVYDKFGNLTYVVPPKAGEQLNTSFFNALQLLISTVTVADQEVLLLEATQAVELKPGFHSVEGSTFTARVNDVPNTLQNMLDGLCYQYVYDDRNRLVDKKIPGKGWEYIVYDLLDRPVLTQDANQREPATNEWLFTKYDALGRVAYTGIFKSNSSRDQLQDQFNTKSNPNENYEEKVSSGTGFAGTYYTNGDFPTAITTTDVLTVNYYDDYSFDRDGLNLPSANVYAHALLNYNNANPQDTKGLATGSKVRVLGVSDWITTVMGYDEHRREVWTGIQNDYLATTDYVETKLDDITAWVLETNTRHIRSGSTLTTVEKFTYDHSGKLINHTHKVNSQAEERISANTYDDIGQLTRKRVGGLASGSNELQVVDYAYNIRGWLKQINDPSALGTTDLFGFKINYNSADHSGTALYNGNISETEWKTANDNTLRWYRYTYDALNRIIKATDNNNRYSLTSVNYDKNGNITRLKRLGHTNQAATSFGSMDDLVYTYDSGNKLTKVLDNYNDTYGFSDGADTTTEYTYDANGNMITDANKGITAISYNHLNLPTSISINGAGGNGTISYIYDATGTKLRKTVGSSVTDYAGNYVYQNNNLQFFSHPEGYVTPDGGSGYDYIYQYKDHLGNIRLSYVDNNGTTEIVEENNYYPFGLKHKGYNESVSPLGNSVANRWKFGGKELDDSFNDALATYDFGARNYNPALGRWMNIDPLAEIYHTDTPYAYVLNNPLSYIDPDGRQVVGVNKNDAEYFHNVLKRVFAGDQFEQLRSLFTRGKNNNKRKFDKIEGSSLNEALSGLEGDDLALAEVVVSAINSEDVHKVEFIERTEDVSTEGSTAIVDDANSAGTEFQLSLNKDGRLHGSQIINMAGGGINAPTEQGSHSVIVSDIFHPNGIDVVSFHEVFGHGIPAAKKTTRKANNANAIRTENLVLRVLGKASNQRDGSGEDGKNFHNGGKVNSHKALPIKN